MRRKTIKIAYLKIITKNNCNFKYTFSRMTIHYVEKKLYRIVKILLYISNKR